ncbi:MAG: NAD(P)-binding protein [Bacteroidetes bacterium]|nr:NAD(P)-binding protein [Bacteroidota bacterium]
MKSKSIAIIGGGPSGCALAILLKRAGHKVDVFYIETSRNYCRRITSTGCYSYA